MQINLTSRDWNNGILRGKEIKQNMLWKKIIVKGNIRTKYSEYKYKNTEISSFKSICISKLQCLNSFIYTSSVEI